MDLWISLALALDINLFCKDVMTSYPKQETFKSLYI